MSPKKVPRSKLIISSDDMSRCPGSWNLLARMTGRDWRGFAGGGGNFQLTGSNDQSNAFLVISESAGGP